MHDSVSASEDQAEDALLDHFEVLGRYFPQAAQVPWRHYVAGLSTYTLDGRYLIGALPVRRRRRPLSVLLVQYAAPRRRCPPAHC